MSGHFPTLMAEIQWLIESYGIVASAMAVVCLMLSKNHRLKKAGQNLIVAIILNALILICDIVGIHYDGKPGQTAYHLVWYSNFFLYLFQHLLLVFVSRYVYEKIAFHDPKTEKRTVYVVYGIFTIFFLGLIANIFTGCYFYVNEYNVYCRGILCSYTMVSGATVILLQTCRVWKNRHILDKEECLALLSYFFFPGIGLILQLCRYGYSFMNIGMTISVIFVLVEYTHQQHVIREEQERKMALSRAYLLISQIKPHFLFNSLSVIQSLIEDDPETAQIALGHFSKYLRKNLDLKASDSEVPIEEELEFLNNYLYIQTLRFGDKIKIQYEVDENLDFKLPFLTIQPIVENAIGHGLRKKMEGGTVLIRIFEEDGWNVIQIVDDGVGFDPSKLPEEKEQELDIHSNGVGMNNVEERLRLLSHGEMQIQSVIGMGTTITLRIPKEEKE